jgi:S-formylglutathione hydrolase FrmB
MLGSLVASLACTLAGAAQPMVSAAVKDDHGFLVHEVRVEYQSGTTKIRVLLPDRIEPGHRYPVIYVLPVEAKDENRYGDGLLEIKKLGLHNQYQAIFVAPTFAQLPWYADHPSDPAIRQEAYLLLVVLPFIERTYPAEPRSSARLLLGFSKSGWGAFTLLLRHPDVFGKAVAWDAPLMMTRPDRFGAGPIFGSQENFEKYQVSKLLEAAAATLGKERRLIHLGYGNFRDDHRRAEELLQRLNIPHEYRDGPARKHDWHSGWVAEAVALLLCE